MSTRTVRHHSIVRILAVLGTLLAVSVAAWPVLTGAQDGTGRPDGPDTAGIEGSNPVQAEDRSGPAGPTAGVTVSRLASQPDDEAEPTGADQGPPSMVYVDSSLEIAPDGEFGTVIEVADAPAGSDLAVQIYDRITTLEQLEASASEIPANLLATFDTIPLAAENPPATQLSSFVISLYTSGQSRPPGAGAWAYRLDEPGVYPVRVRLRGPEGEQLDSLVVYLARTAGAATPASADAEDSEDLSGPATRVALMARIHEDPPTHDADSTPASIVEQSLEAGRVSAIDRLVTALTDRADMPVGFSITPDTARRMHDDITSRPTVERMRAALVDDDRVLLSAPYVDLDLVALVNQGLNGELDSQILLGYQHLEATLGQTGNDTWFVDRPIDRATVDALAARSVTGLVVAPEVLADDHLAPVLVDGAESTLMSLPLFDSGLTEAQTSSGGDPNDLLAAHHAVGRLAALRGVEPQGAAVAVGIDADVDPDRLNTFLDLIGTASDHLELTTVDLLLDRAAETDAELATLAPPTETGDGDAADELRSTRARVDSYRSMLVPDSPTLNQFDLPLAMSLAADRDDEARRADLEEVDSLIDIRLGSVATPERDRVTLGTRDATFPLPITTDSDEPLRVRVHVNASDRVELPRNDFEATLSGERTVVQIPVRALASGDTALLITVTTPDGEVVLAQSRYSVRSTAVSGVGVVLTVGAGGFLAVWWGRHWHRTRKDRRAEARHARNIPHEDVTSV